MNNNWREKQSEKWKSSYEDNSLGFIFYSLVKTYKPEKIVELGTKAGYSAEKMAKALLENGKGKIYCYDLWEKYEYTSCPKSKAEKNLEMVRSVVELKQEGVENAFFDHDSVDILHIDLGNHAEILDKILLPWLEKVKKLIIIEGGSEERDQVDWMKKYEKKSINNWLKSNKDKFDYFIIEPYPSITLIKPKEIN